MKNTAKSLLIYEELTWKDVRDRVSKLNPQLAKIIDDINPPKSHVLIKVSCPYGSEILKGGVLHLPLKGGEWVPYHDARFDKHLKELFAYNVGSNPISMLLKNTAELFFELEDRAIPFAIIPPGKLFGTWKILDGSVQYCPAGFFWGLTAGARSVFLLPKISEAGGYSRLKKQCGVVLDKAKNLLDHWKVFKEIADTEPANKKWETEFLFFSGYWFEHKSDKAWVAFNYYLTQSAWEGSIYWRNQFIWSTIFSIIQKKIHVKSPIYILNIIKQLLGIATGSLLGFQPALDDSLAPVSYLQNVFSNIYNLKNLAPVIMQPATFNLSDPNASPVYYSLQYPTSVEFSPKPNDKTSTLVDLYYVQYYLRKYVEEILHGTLNDRTTLLYVAAKTVQFDYFHNNTGSHKEIRESQSIFTEDESFQKSFEKYSNKVFPKISSFLNGCIRLSLCHGTNKKAL